MSQSLVSMMLTIFYVVWLLAVLVFLWMVWRNGVTRSQRLESALVEAALVSAKAAGKTAEAVLILAQEQGKHTLP
jgi:predicted negative regulator of RcsB-dependent stress response